MVAIPKLHAVCRPTSSAITTRAGCWWGNAQRLVCQQCNIWHQNSSLRAACGQKLPGPMIVSPCQAVYLTKELGRYLNGNLQGKRCHYPSDDCLRDKGVDSQLRAPYRLPVLASIMTTRKSHHLISGVVCHRILAPGLQQDRTGKNTCTPVPNRVPTLVLTKAVACLA